MSNRRSKPKAMSTAELSTDGYIFLNISRPHVAWATYRGVLITQTNITSDSWKSLSWWRTDLHRNSPLLKREAMLEKVREQTNPGKISRLNGIFCFLDRDSAAMASSLWGSEHFKMENLAVRLRICHGGLRGVALGMDHAGEAADDAGFAIGRPQRNSFSRLWPVQISDHSPCTFSSPRSRN